MIHFRAIKKFGPFVQSCRLIGLVERTRLTLLLQPCYEIEQKSWESGIATFRRRRRRRVLRTTVLSFLFCFVLFYVCLVLECGFCFVDGRILKFLSLLPPPPPPLSLSLSHIFTLTLTHTQQTKVRLFCLSLWLSNLISDSGNGRRIFCMAGSDWD